MSSTWYTEDGVRKEGENPSKRRFKLSFTRRKKSHDENGEPSAVSDPVTETKDPSLSTWYENDGCEGIGGVNDSGNGPEPSFQQRRMSHTKYSESRSILVGGKATREVEVTGEKPEVDDKKPKKPAKKKSGDDLAVPCRDLGNADLDGWLFKKSGGFGSWKKLWCALKDGVLYVYKTSFDILALHVIKMSQYDAVALPDDKRKFSFKLNPKPSAVEGGASIKAHSFSAEAQEGVTSWVDTLKKASDGIAVTKATLQTPEQDRRRCYSSAMKKHTNEPGSPGATAEDVNRNRRPQSTAFAGNSETTGLPSSFERQGSTSRPRRQSTSNKTSVLAVGSMFNSIESPNDETPSMEKQSLSDMLYTKKEIIVVENGAHSPEDAKEIEELQDDIKKNMLELQQTTMETNESEEDVVAKDSSADAKPVESIGETSNTSLSEQRASADGMDSSNNLSDESRTSVVTETVVSTTKSETPSNDNDASEESVTIVTTTTTTVIEHVVVDDTEQCKPDCSDNNEESTEIRVSPSGEDVEAKVNADAEPAAVPEAAADAMQVEAAEVPESNEPAQADSATEVVDVVQAEEVQVPEAVEAAKIDATEQVDQQPIEIDAAPEAPGCVVDATADAAESVASDDGPSIAVTIIEAAPEVSSNDEPSALEATEAAEETPVSTSVEVVASVADTPTQECEVVVAEVAPSAVESSSTVQVTSNVEPATIEVPPQEEEKPCDDAATVAIPVVTVSVEGDDKAVDVTSCQDVIDQAKVDVAPTATTDEAQATEQVTTCVSVQDDEKSVDDAAVQVSTTEVEQTMEADASPQPSSDVSDPSPVAVEATADSPNIQVILDQSAVHLSQESTL